MQGLRHEARFTLAEKAEERNFAAFFYFFSMLRLSQTESGRLKIELLDKAILNLRLLKQSLKTNGKDTNGANT
jgi:hypothetical protein